MPTYEYQCQKCGSVFDVFQSIKAAPLRRSHCESCGAPQSVRRLIGTGGAVLFKGSGFYQTDYRSDSYKKAAESDSKPASTDAAKSDSASSKEGAPSKPAAEKKSPAAPKKKKD